MVTRALPLVVAALALTTGALGFRLDPDTSLYASGALTPYSPLGGLVGRVAGLAGVVVVSAIAAGACVALVPGRRRWWFALASLLWFVFPGVDALGALLVLLMLRARTMGGRVAGLAAAGLAHPVAALTSAPLAVRRDRLGLAVSAGATVAAIVGVGLYDAFSTTDRYALPLLCAMAVRS